MSKLPAVRGAPLLAILLLVAPIPAPAGTIAAGLELGLIEPSGRLSSEANPFEIAPGGLSSTSGSRQRPITSNL